MLLEKKVIEKILDAGMATGADFAETFVEENYHNNYQLVSGQIEKANGSKSFGIGIRLALGLQSVYGYTNSQNPDDMGRSHV